jgi:hypothetical protein
VQGVVPHFCCFPSLQSDRLDESTLNAAIALVTCLAPTADLADHRGELRQAFGKTLSDEFAEGRKASSLSAERGAAFAAVRAYRQLPGSSGEGDGVVLGRSALVADDLRAGRLVRYLTRVEQIGHQSSVCGANS